MSTPTTHEDTKAKVSKKRPTWFGWAWKIAVVVVLAGLGVALLGGRAETRVDGATFAARRGPLHITVVEGGEIESQESQWIRSEVQGQTQIISIVEEGYRVTQEDIENGKTLVELDSSDLYERSTQQEIQYQNAQASLTEAREQYDIQVKQNESDIRTAELNILFARMDFEKYLGAELGQAILQQIGLDADSVEILLASDDDTRENSSRRSAGIDLASLVSDLRLGGEAQQTRRRLESDITLAQEELKQAETRHEWTQRLSEQGFVTAAEEEQDRMTVQRREVQLQSAMTAEELFLRYEFAKQIESLVSDYEEAISRLERARKEASSRLAQAEARLRSNEATYALQESRREELLEQLEKCLIPAEREGIVVYASSTGNYRGDPIEEGTMVRERQDILMIPDMNKMAVRVRIHESAINRIRQGQQALVRADSFPQETLRGQVARVAMLPDSTSRWMNPDLRVFATVVSIEGSYEWLKPGMSAQAEILISQYDDVVYVPIQAVTTLDNERVVYVTGGGNATPRPVEVGEYNDRFIVIESGLKEGENVLLRPPRPDTDATRTDDMGIGDMDMNQLDDQPVMDPSMDDQPVMSGEGDRPAGGGMPGSGAGPGGGGMPGGGAGPGRGAGRGGQS